MIDLAKRLLLLVALVGCGRHADSETLTRLRAAEEIFTSATQEEQFLDSALQHEKVIQNGFVSGKALYNQGNAFFRSAELGRAIASYRQSLRYRPRDAQLIANLETALGRPLEYSSRRTVWDYVFLWQRWLSYREKFQLATLFLVVSLALFWYSHWNVPSIPLRRIAILAGLICGLFVGSSILDWHRIEHQRRGVLTQEVTPRKGNSENYEPAFTRPLPEGTEFLVDEQRGEWIRGRFDDDAVGWLRVDASITY